MASEKDAISPDWVVRNSGSFPTLPIRNILLRLMDGTNEVYICGWKLEKGAIATPWTMNPNDTGYVGNIHGFMEITQTPTQFYEDRIDTIDFIEY